MELFVQAVCFCTDSSSSLGRIDTHSLSQQTLMELFMMKIENKEDICGKQSSPKDISEWSGVQMNDKQEVVELHFWAKSFVGTVDLQWLPLTLRKIWLTGSKGLTCTIDLDSLPEKLEVVDLSSNAFTGDINLRKLPNTLVTMSAAYNQLCGTLDLSDLPDLLVSLMLQDNRFYGSVDLTRLPRPMESLFLNQNALSGPVNLTRLPRGIIRVFLGSNAFSGETEFGQMPDSLETFDVQQTELSGQISLLASDAAEKNFYLTGSKVQLKHKSTSPQ